MKATIALVIAAIAAFLYFKPSSQVIEAPKVVEPVATAPQPGIVVAPVTEGRMADRFKTGPNTQTNLTPNTDRWKTGLNAQTNLTPNTDRWKTGPNAQINLTPNTDRWKTGPNAQTDLPPK
jgi:hypothetical protein